MTYRGPRSRVVNDLVLLDSLDEDSILRALEGRHSKDEIYCYVGETLISLNPYRQINGLYGANVMKKYIGKKDYQNEPHAYATAERAYRSMQLAATNECIVITGESGSGKTEASKVCMNYIAFLASKSRRVQRVKEQLLETNPLLEAFGNAKTRRNDNSSRFGKYFEILFKFNDPEGGRISQFLLEKNRVTHQQRGERNFHVFYQVMSDPGLVRELRLTGDHKDYRYFADPNSKKVATIDDARDLQVTKKAMEWVGIEGSDQRAVFRAIGAILHLGNIEFMTAQRNHRGGASDVKNRPAVQQAADLMGCSVQSLCHALTNRTVRSGKEEVSTSLNKKLAKFARDSLAKTMYGALFKWIVKRANETIHCDQHSTSIGVLDIYGFEILGVNGFDQLCINHTNERLHQLFIELTLRREQEEYQREGIAWKKVDFYDNLPICTMIERPTGGIYAIIDEECIFPERNDDTLHGKLGSNLRERFFTLGQGQQFVINHYAGKVTYDTKGMINSNKDTLNIDLVVLCNQCKNPVVRELMQDHPAAKSNHYQRPPTTCQQYKQQVKDLMETLKSCNQHYIRCIKPNDQKAAGVFQRDLCVQQVRYLGLLENVKVRRAGYAFRMDFDEFMSKYKTTMDGFPEFQPDSRRGVEQIMRDNGARGYEMGRTKIFIKDAKTILAIEDKRKEYVDYCASMVPKDDGFIWADKVWGFNSKFVRMPLHFVVGGKGFYYFSKTGKVEHFIPSEKCEIISYNDREGWMVVTSSYPSKIKDEPDIQISYLSENVYSREVENVVSIISNMGYNQVRTARTNMIPEDAQNQQAYKELSKRVVRGALPKANTPGVDMPSCLPGDRCVVQ